MVRYRRNFVPGGTYFFTVTLSDRRSFVLVHHIDVLRAAFRKTRAERPFAGDAIVVLPEHLHAILTLPDGDADFPSRWRRIKALFTHGSSAQLQLKATHKGEFQLWQRRFWEHTIRDESDLIRHVDYILYDPVKHGLVRRAADWQHSSFHRYVSQGLLAED